MIKEDRAHRARPPAVTRGWQCVSRCALLCFIEPVVGGLGRGLLIKGLLTWGFRPNHFIASSLFILTLTSPRKHFSTTPVALFY
jgi:hypothetical protein